MSEASTITAPHKALGMSDEEYQAVIELLGREPEPAELAMYSVMWSEHCSYKSSRKWLSRFPTEAPWVVVGPGENAGVVDLGDGWLAALRIESHNHPSFVEPYQGAATGVGGILRDVFTMGARPIALWNQIRFGPLTDPANRYLFSGVVSGIAGYGNAVGVPTVGGEIEFDSGYDSNPLVNVMALGLMKRDDLVLAQAGPPGTIGVLLGGSTGRDGIGGASVLASTGFEAEAQAKRPSVQVGDPFEEKKLIEACLELYGRKLVVGIQDLGAAGLTCSTAEPTGRSGTGITLDLDQVHVREPGMSAAELLMSESQERMMAYVEPGLVEDVLEVAKRWEIEARVVAEVQSGDRLRVTHRGQIVADVPASSLSGEAPLYDRPRQQPASLESTWAAAAPPPPHDLAETLLGLLADPAIGDSSWVWEQYDHQLFLNTVVGPGGDGTLLRVKGTQKGIAVSTDGHSRRSRLDPRRGAERLVYEGALNVAVTGARPLAVVDNLNFGNPENPEVMWQLIESIEGIALACEALGIPVVGGNVSFYNETGGRDIPPTPVVGVMGLADPMPAAPPRLSRGGDAHRIWLLGELDHDLAGSSYQRLVASDASGRPQAAQPQLGVALTEAAALLADRLPVLHDVSDGGVAAAVAEICIQSDLGARVTVPSWQALFGEPAHLLVAAGPAALEGEVQSIGDRLGVPVTESGSLGGTEIELRAGEETATVALSAARDAWAGAVPRYLEGPVGSHTKQ